MKLSRARQTIESRSGPAHLLARQNGGGLQPGGCHLDLTRGLHPGFRARCRSQGCRRSVELLLQVLDGGDCFSSLAIAGEDCDHVVPHRGIAAKDDHRHPGTLPLVAYQPDVHRRQHRSVVPQDAQAALKARQDNLRRKGLHRRTLRSQDLDKNFVRPLPVLAPRRLRVPFGPGSPVQQRPGAAEEGGNLAETAPCEQPSEQKGQPP
mmetsp:Transcript_7249/g.22134  ORF Transcript_7249/g.22134 Transcript_7249/m.22134 type:complete len:207 (-) Transcript_7249:180-800(-)